MCTRYVWSSIGRAPDLVGRAMKCQSLGRQSGEERSRLTIFYDDLLANEAKHQRPEWKQAAGPATFAIKYGRPFERARPPRIRHSWHRKQKQCFRNAYLNVLKYDPVNFVYCEGMTWRSTGFPFEHAWFIDRRQPNAAIDTTLDYDAEYSYLGVPLRLQYVQKIISHLQLSVSIVNNREMSWPLLMGTDLAIDVIEKL
jgi:hypothetical protein